VFKKSIVLPAFFPSSMENTQHFLNAIRILREHDIYSIEFYIPGIKNPIYTKITEIVEIIQKELDCLDFNVISCDSEGYPETSDQITIRAIDAAK